MTGPYQMCLKCKTEKNHKWVNETHYACITCGTTHKILAKMSKPEGMEHLEPEQISELQEVISNEPIAEVKVLKKEKKVETNTIIQSELPKQGHEIKPTSLDTPGINKSTFEVSFKKGWASGL